MSALDVLRAFAESRSGDSEIVRDGFTYHTCRAAVLELAALRAQLASAETALYAALEHYPNVDVLNEVVAHVTSYPRNSEKEGV